MRFNLNTTLLFIIWVTGIWLLYAKIHYFPFGIDKGKTFHLSLLQSAGIVTGIGVVMYQVIKGRG